MAIAGQRGSLSRTPGRLRLPGFNAQSYRPKAMSRGAAGAERSELALDIALGIWQSHQPRGRPKPAIAPPAIETPRFFMIVYSNVHDSNGAVAVGTALPSQKTSGLDETSGRLTGRARGHG